MTSSSLENVYNFDDLEPLALRDDPVEYRRFYDQSAGFTAQNSPVQNHFHFRVSDINSLWLLHRGYLLVEFEVTAGVANERATLANGLGHLFERCILRLGDTIIEDKPRHFHREFEVDAMSWSKQYAETVGSMMLYHPRDAAGPDYSLANHSRALFQDPGQTTQTTSPDPFDVSTTPQGKNRILTDQSPTYAMIPLYHLFNFPKVYQKFIRGYDVELELYTTSDKIRLIRSLKTATNTASGTTDSTLTWSGPGISLYLPRIVPPAGVMAKINNMLSGDGIKPLVEFEKSNVYRETIPIARSDG